MGEQGRCGSCNAMCWLTIPAFRVQSFEIDVFVVILPTYLYMLFLPGSLPKEIRPHRKRVSWLVGFCLTYLKNRGGRLAM